MANGRPRRRPAPPRLCACAARLAPQVSADSEGPGQAAGARGSGVGRLRRGAGGAGAHEAHELEGLCGPQQQPTRIPAPAARAPLPRPRWDLPVSWHHARSPCDSDTGPRGPAPIPKRAASVAPGRAWPRMCSARAVSCGGDRPPGALRLCGSAQPGGLVGEAPKGARLSWAALQQRLDLLRVHAKNLRPSPGACSAAQRRSADGTVSRGRDSDCRSRRKLETGSLLRMHARVLKLIRRRPDLFTYTRLQSPQRLVKVRGSLHSKDLPEARAAPAAGIRRVTLD